MKYLFLALIAIMAATLSSCIDGDEELYIEADGSARVIAKYRIPALLFSDEDATDLKLSLAEEVGKQANLKLITNEIVKIEGYRVIHIEIATDDLMELEDMLIDHGPEAEANLSKGDELLHAILGSIDVKLKGLSADFTRDVDLSSMLDKHLGKRSAAILGDSKFSYTIHLPKAVEQSNAHWVENEGRTLKWVYKLSECREKPISIKMVASIPLPWWVYAIGAGITLLIALLVWKLVKIMRPVVA